MSNDPTRRAIRGWIDTIHREADLQRQVQDLEKIIVEVRQRLHDEHGAGCKAIVDDVAEEHGRRIMFPLV